MRDEIEAAALFITRLVNKNLSQAGASTPCSSASSIDSNSSSASSASSTSSDSPPEFDEQMIGTMTASDDLHHQNQQQQQQHHHHHYHQQPQHQHHHQEHQPIDKVEQFRQCLMDALYERFHNHWFPDQPQKGQAYRCIRLNKWDRRDITLQKACLQCGIDYNELQLPVELTLWVDPDEVSCRFGESEGSNCLVARFKDGGWKCLSTREFK